MYGITNERIDGTGYPDGIKGDDIEFFARIISVADAFDAMMSDRHYRRHLSLEDTVKQLKNGAGTQFDTKVVDAFLSVLKTDKEVQKKIQAFDAERH